MHALEATLALLGRSEQERLDLRACLIQEYETMNRMVYHPLFCERVSSRVAKQPLSEDALHELPAFRDWGRLTFYEH